MKPRHWISALLLTSLSGCGSTQSPITPRAPHNGMVVDLPDNKGLLEIVRQEIADQPGHDRLLLYFMDESLKPMSPTPTVATLKLRGRQAGTIELRAPSGANSTQAGLLESADLAGQGDLSGELSTTIAGKPVSLSITVR